ncbi:IS110 family transposase [Candidatus Bathyarchaeota archaeon]|nr:IS110 family transposase [Candidatus Bathyarchaeota archaeon]
MLYVGLDVHKKVCYGTMMNEKGDVVKHGRFSRDPRCLKEFMAGVDEASVVMEAGYCWQPVYEWLEKDGYEVKLAHPTETKAIAKAKVKADKIDSKILAHLLRCDLVPESWVPPREVRELRGLVKHRAFLVRMRTRLKNRVHAELDGRDIDLHVPLFTGRGRELLKCLGIESINQLVAVVEVLDKQILEVSKKIRGLAKMNEDVALLTTIPGVGYYTALLLLAEIGDVSRFPDSEKLCAYAGLVPSVYRSGEKTVYGPITKEGSRWIRWALTQSVHAHVRYDTRLSRFYRSLAKKKGKQVAAVATGRKMLKVVYWMLKNREEFRSLGEEA